MIPINLIPTSGKLPENGQKVLVDMGNFVDPAIYNADTGLFQRYPNHGGTDRIMTYYYAGVLAWEPFPEPSRKQGFVNEPELPFPSPEFPELKELDVPGPKLPKIT